ncbi:solute:hydrogen antiporter [Rhodotorula toruloides]|uniref:Solute:hydrogen antiporter n=1 Tax=Rhodotorula toruloides TaxID=5286 RepID=A0A511KPB1_RHOTO|nr:solute:hydrogen antiporter [Rhodotorula toruloides]
MSSPTAAGTVPYHEPPFTSLAILIAFLFLANVARGAANKVLYAGLLGEITVGVVFGPVARILDVDWERTFVVVGYIGLVLIVFEGGLTLRPRSFLPQLPLALITALIGILLPLAFTFALFSAFVYPQLQAFSAGSALASTSLGTTFYVLRASGPELGTTAVGEILKGAALIDDVVALVLLSVIQSLGTELGGSLGWTIGRPIVASVAMAAVSPVTTLWLFRPLFRWRRIARFVERGGRPALLLLGVAVLIAYLAIAYYTGTTMLLGAFLAGTFLSALPAPDSGMSFVTIWEEVLVPVQEYIFAPLFFASIGFSIPFLSLWTGRRIWRGLIYALLMALGKLLAGIPILLVDLFRSDNQNSALPEPPSIDFAATTGVRSNTEAEKAHKAERMSLRSVRLDTSTPSVRQTLPAAAFVGVALVARGEIGILVLQVAYAASNSSDGTEVLGDEAYLVGIWAVAVCTILGPVAIGLLVKKEGERIKCGRWGLT